MEYDAGSNTLLNPPEEAKQLSSTEPGWASWTYEEAEAWLNGKPDSYFEDGASMRGLIKKMSRMIIWLRDYTQMIDKSVPPPDPPA